MRTHLYQPDHTIAIDGRGEHPCSTCGFPKQWRGHDVPELPPEVAEIGARILGERDDPQTVHAGAERVRSELERAQ